MASPMRSAGMRGANNNPDHEYVLSVTPLNSMPYIGPSAPDGGHAVSPTKDDTNTRPAETVGPSMLFLPPHTSRQEWDDLMVSSKTGVGLTGSAAMGKVGPVVGLMDVGESDDAYLFRVSLPGVSRDEKEFHCDIEADGRVLIKGITTTGERTVCKYSQVFRMQTQNLCPPGHFSIAFQLPGPVDQQQFSGRFETDGMLEGIVKKKLIRG